MNFAVDGPEAREVAEDVLATIFGSEPFQWMPEASDILDVLVAAHVFPSRGQAKKNYSGAREIKVGMTDLAVGRHRLFIWKHPNGESPEAR